MSTRMIYDCDRCKRKDVGTVFNVDLGNDYSSPPIYLASEKQKVRLNRDLCKECWVSLKAWLEQGA